MPLVGKIRGVTHWEDIQEWDKTWNT